MAKRFKHLGTRFKDLRAELDDTNGACTQDRLAKELK